MYKAIIIIHPSSIVQAGLSNIVRRVTDAPLHVINDTSQLKSLKDVCDTHFICLFDPGQENATNPYMNLDSSNKISEIKFDLSTSDKVICNHIERIWQNSQTNITNPEEDLSQREKEVLKMVALGYQNKEIADQLFISIHTVISHRKNITSKLGIKSISGLTVYALINNIIDPSTLEPGSFI